jgi:MFS transporter, ACS family, tartrate transporter
MGELAIRQRQDHFRRRRPRPISTDGALVSKTASATQAIVWIGVNMQNGPFWSLPGSLVSGTAAAGGIALIARLRSSEASSVPIVFGPMSDAFHGYTARLGLLAALALSASAIALALRARPS